MLGRVELNDVTLRQGRIQWWFDLGEIRVVGEVAVAVVHCVGPSQRQIFLIGFPALSGIGQLIGNGNAKRGGDCCDCQSPVDVDLAGGGPGPRSCNPGLA